MCYLSQCPHCQTNYQLSLKQLSIAQGSVRCVRCQHVFDAYLHFINSPEPVTATNVEYPTLTLFNNQNFTQDTSTSQGEMENKSNPHIHYVNQILAQEVDGSRLNLYTYLNCLDTLHPLHNKVSADFTAPHLKMTEPKLKPHSPSYFSYYFCWGIVNFSLILLLVFQYYFFNAK